MFNKNKNKKAQNGTQIKVKNLKLTVPPYNMPGGGKHKRMTENIKLCREENMCQTKENNAPNGRCSLFTYTMITSSQYQDACLNINEHQGYVYRMTIQLQ